MEPVEARKIVLSAGLSGPTSMQRTVDVPSDMPALDVVRIIQLSFGIRTCDDVTVTVRRTRFHSGRTRPLQREAAPYGKDWTLDLPLEGSTAQTLIDELFMEHAQGKFSIQLLRTGWSISVEYVKTVDYRPTERRLCHLTGGTGPLLPAEVPFHDTYRRVLAAALDSDADPDGTFKFYRDLLVVEDFDPKPARELMNLYDRNRLGAVPMTWEELFGPAPREPEGITQAAMERNFTRGAERMLRIQAHAATQAMAGNTSSDPYAGVGRDDPCPCGSGRKYKFCHGTK